MGTNSASQTAIAKSSDIQDLLGMLYDQIVAMDQYSDELENICDRVSNSSKLESVGNENKKSGMHQGGHLAQLEEYVTRLIAISQMMASSVNRLNRYF